MKKLFLVDCNNFYVSCERVFNPTLRNKPVVVLSSNDACVIARSQEAKQLGIPMGAAAWEYEAFFKRHNVIVHSANFPLYGDMSARVMRTLNEYAADIEIYSVDEAFLYINQQALTTAQSYTSYAQQLKTVVKQRTGIPISIGIGTTKTLAKIANHLAKKNAHYQGVCDICNTSAIDALLAMVPVEDIWGIGYRYAKKVRAYGASTARELKYAPDAWIKKHLTIMGLKTVHELRGIPCQDLHTLQETKQSITVSRLFGEKTKKAEDLRQALASYVATAAQKLRAQQSLSSHISVFAITAYYHDEQSRFQAMHTTLPFATAYTPTLIAAAQKCLEQLYVPGLTYKKVGVILSDLIAADALQLHTYLPAPNLVKETAIMRTVDTVNRRFGRHKISFAAAGTQQPWKMKQLKKSACFTTNWHELLTIRI